MCNPSAPGRLATIKKQDEPSSTARWVLDPTVAVSVAVRVQPCGLACTWLQLARIYENMQNINALARVGRAILHWQGEEAGGISPPPLRGKNRPQLKQLGSSLVAGPFALFLFVLEVFDLEGGLVAGAGFEPATFGL